MTKALSYSRRDTGSRSSTAESDNRLMACVGAGDQAALRALYGRHNVKVFRFALRIVPQESPHFENGPFWGLFPPHVERSGSLNPDIRRNTTLTRQFRDPESYFRTRHARLAASKR